MIHLSFSKAKYQALRDRLLQEEPDLDEQTLADTLEGLTDLHEVIGAIVRSAVCDESLAKGLRVRVDEMQARLARLRRERRSGGKSHAR